ncbi:MAG: hypothetical protein ACRDS9_25395 [Pseudonocardiaceae bacterium]
MTFDEFRTRTQVLAGSSLDQGMPKPVVPAAGAALAAVAATAVVVMIWRWSR